MRLRTAKPTSRPTALDVVTNAVTDWAKTNPVMPMIAPP